MIDHERADRKSRLLRRALGGLALTSVLSSGGCLSSVRHDFLAVRAAAPSPTPAARTTLAEAEMSNVGPARPRTAMAGGDFDR